MVVINGNGLKLLSNITAYGSGISDVAEFQHQSRLELQNLKFSTICQTKYKTPHLAKLLL